MLGLPSRGSRACTCRMAAPACAAATPCSASMSGETGSAGDIVAVWMPPVSAHETMTLFVGRAMVSVVELDAECILSESYCCSRPAAHGFTQTVVGVCVDRGTEELTPARSRPRRRRHAPTICRNSNAFRTAFAFPSLLKYTKTSRHIVCHSRIRSAHHRMSASSYDPPYRC